MLKKSGVLLIFLYVLLIRCNDDDNNDIFVPSKQWQTVKKGQKIPKGLHVRINLETGQTEAKLLDEDQPPKTKALTTVPQENPEINELFTKFRTYDDIKKSLGDLNLTPKMDAEVITDLLKKHNEILTTDPLNHQELLIVLEDLDYLAHQYDNAREFVKQNGFKEVIYKNLNSTNAEIRKETLKLMAALMQNNVNPKIHALETGAIAILLRLINFENNDVQHRALSALGALLRSFPVAQKNFVESGGLAILSKFFDTDNIKIQIRLVTMISDLIVEHKWAVGDEMLSKYYVSFDLTRHILEHDWCTKLNKLLLGLLITDKDDHDSAEKCLTAMHSLRAYCGNSYEKELLLSLQKRYQLLSEDSFFANLKELCDEILHYTSVKTEL